jgi:hypothetical protein
MENLKIKSPYKDKLLTNKKENMNVVKELSAIYVFWLVENHHPMVIDKLKIKTSNLILKMLMEILFILST